MLGKHQKVIVQWPSILSLVFLLGRFIYILVKDLRIHLQLEAEVSRQREHSHVRHHICSLGERCGSLLNEDPLAGSLLNAEVTLLQEPEELMEQHQMQHVRDLLRKTPVCR